MSVMRPREIDVSCPTCNAGPPKYRDVLLLTSNHFS